MRLLTGHPGRQGGGRRQEPVVGLPVLRGENDVVTHHHSIERTARVVVEVPAGPQDHAAVITGQKQNVYESQFHALSRLVDVVAQALDAERRAA